MIVTTAQLFKHAYGKYAIGAYNINNAEQAMGLAAIAGLVALLIYTVATSVEPAAAGVTLAVASLAAAAGVLLLVESSPL